MNTDVDTRIERALFDVAVDLDDPVLRAAFIEKISAADQALGERLVVLLADHARAETFFDFAPAPPSSSPAPLAAAPESKTESFATVVVPAVSAARSDPERIGSYRIVRRLGEGGWGVVYLADQEEPVRRQVALKVIRLGMDTERVIARFASERQALAMMNHPHIARVFDAGVTADGRPFFAMELVAGERITAYCDRRRLDVRRRVELFIHVCHAVQHAHQKGVIHRDLKPSNVLVAESEGGGPAPKIIDFGISKAISGEGGETGVTLAAEQFIGTPAYMSPEQAEPGREDMDTRSDIYSLGALLHELLTGRPAFDGARLMAAGLDELRRILREVDPPAPSVLLRSLPEAERVSVAERLGCSPARLVSILDRDLDWIVMRALEKDRVRRYATVQGLALDLRRHLDDEPVFARPPSRIYQLGKLVRRHRGVFLASSAVLLALVGGLGTSTWLFFRERAALREQARLRGEAEDAEKISRAVFLTRENRMEEANAILAAVGAPPDRPSFEGLTAYRSVGDWLAARRRWAEALERFAVVERVGRLDAWDSVTLDHQSYGVALLQNEDFAGYERFTREHARRFAQVTNGDAVSRVLKVCLLRPLDPELERLLHPLSERVERWFSSLPPRSAANWAAVPVALWRYRSGQFDDAEKAARLGYEPGDRSSARTATLRVLLALCAMREGGAAEARSLLAEARHDVAAKFSGDMSVGNGRDGFWYDWAFAHLLLIEAEAALVGHD